MSSVRPVSDHLETSYLLYCGPIKTNFFEQKFLTWASIDTWTKHMVHEIMIFAVFLGDVPL